MTRAVGVRNDVRYTTTYNVGRQAAGCQASQRGVRLHGALGSPRSPADAKPGEDAIYNGASDNATGIVGTDRTRRGRSRRREPRPQRSLLFVAVTAEESGLLGSEYFAAHPPLPVAQMAGGLNMDNLYAIGRTRDITGDRLWRRPSSTTTCVAAAANKAACSAQEPTPEKGFYYRSDHFNLAKQGVPMLYTKAGIDSPTKGADYGKRWLDDYVAHRYHKPSDEYSPAWDVSGIVQDLAVYYDVGSRDRELDAVARTGAQAASSARSVIAAARTSSDAEDRGLTQPAADGCTSGT